MTMTRSARRAAARAQGTNTARMALAGAAVLAAALAGCSDVPGDDPGADQTGDGADVQAVLDSLGPAYLDAADQAGIDPQILATEYVRTPAGLVHRSCVHAIEAGDNLDGNGDILRARGARDAIAPCGYPEIRALTDQKVRPPGDSPASGHPPAVNGWIEEANAYAYSTIGAMAANWWVPSTPGANHGQLIYLFPALQHTFNDPAIIMQPVLQWGRSPAGGGAYWAAASWIGPIGGNFYHGPLLSAGAGDAFRGVMSGSGCDSNSCSTWSINTYNQSRGTRSNYTYYGNTRTMRRISGGVLEAYGVVSCSDFPRSYTNFHDVHVRNTAGTLLAPGWQSAIYWSGCGDSVYHSQYSVHIHY